MRSILQNIEHRPWPVPGRPWIMQQVWHDLLFAHWPVSLSALRPLIPAGLEIDTFEGRAWVGVVPFRMSGVRMRGLPATPGAARFPELNVRTYVVRDSKPGVWFFSLDAASALAVWGARTFFHLPYFLARMRCEENSGWINYSSARKLRDASPASSPASAPASSSAFSGAHSGASLEARYRPAGEIFNARPGSLEYFLAERYCLYTAAKSGALTRCEIHHPPWPLQLAQASFQENTMATAAGIALPEKESPLLHFSRRQDVLVWAPEKLK
jgi:hypothetical protein